MASLVFLLYFTTACLFSFLCCDCSGSAIMEDDYLAILWLGFGLVCLLRVFLVLCYFYNLLMVECNLHVIDKNSSY